MLSLLSASLLGLERSLSLSNYRFVVGWKIAFKSFSLYFDCRQRAELEDLRRQLEENNSLAGRALRQELDKTREDQERRHQVSVNCAESHH